MALTRISSAGIQTSPTFSGDVRIGLGATLESTGNAYVTGITTLGIGATGEVYLYNPANSALSGTQNSVYGWKAKTYCGGLQVNSTLYLSRSGSNGLSLNYNNATGSYITANSGFLNISVPHGPPMRFYASCFEFHHNHNARQSAFFNTNGAIQLNHNGDKRFETTSTGAIITGIATVTGNLSVGGTVTYEDVTNVDSIGIVTARSGLDVSGISTFSGNVLINGDLEVSSSLAYIRLTDSDSGGDDFGLRNDAGTFFIRDVTHGANRFSINSEGTLRALNRMDFDAGIHLNAGDLRIVDIIKHRDDDDTKIRFPAADTISFETAGSERARFTDDGLFKLSDTPGIAIINGSSSTTGIGTILIGKGLEEVDGGVKIESTNTGPDSDHLGIKFRVHDSQFGSAPHVTSMTLKHDKSVALEGNLNVAGISTFSGNIEVVSTDGGSSAAPEFKLYRNSASPADADYLGQIKFAGESDTGVERNYAKITGKILDASNGTEDGIIEFAHIKAGSQTITGRWRSDSLQLLNSTSLTVAGTTTLTGNLILGTGTKIGFSTDSNTFIGQDNLDRLDFNAGGKRLVSIVEGTNIPVLIVDKDGVNTGQGNQGANYNANPNATELVLGNTSSNNHGMTIVSPSSGNGSIQFSDGSGAGLDSTRGSIVFTHSDNKLSLKSKIGSIVLTHKDVDKLITNDTGVEVVGVLTATSIKTPKYDGDADLNIIMGCCAGIAITDTTTTACCNILLGHGAGQKLFDGASNVILGTCAGLHGTSYSNSIFIGKYAGCTNRGDDNIAMGMRAGEKITTSEYNIFLGPQAGRCASTGSNNIAMGYQVMNLANTTGNNNIAFGHFTGRRIATGVGNIFLGSGAGRYVLGGHRNIGIGLGASYCLSGGCCNITIGINAGSKQTSSNDNILIGTQAGSQNCTGSGNVAVGHSAGYGVRGSNNISIGATAGPGNALTTAVDNIFIGRQSGAGVTSGYKNIMIGVCAGHGHGNSNVAGVGVGTDNVFIGSCAGRCVATASRNVFIGREAGQRINDGKFNVAIGDQAGCCMMSGNSNVAVGAFSAYHTCSGGGNVFMGIQAALCATTTSDSVIIGNTAGKALVSGNNNVAVGKFAGCKLNNGGSNVLMGNCAGYCITGHNNVMLGMSSGFNRSGSKYCRNVLVGQNAGSSAGTLAVGNFDVLLGFNAGCNYTGSCSIGIGHSVCLPIADGQNQLAIGQHTRHWITGNCDFNVGIGTTRPIAKLDVNVGSAVSAFNIEGSEGQLFSVTNNLSSGSIFAVNDITGLPSVDVNADGTIQLAPRGAGELVGIGTTVPTSKLHVVGDALVTGISTFSSSIHVADSILHEGNTGTGIDFANNTIRFDSGGTMNMEIQLGQIQVRNNTRFMIVPQSNTGTSFLDFGRPSDSDIGGISYAHSSDTMSFRIDTSNIADFNKSGLNVSGIVTATSFSGDGSNLTGISAGFSADDDDNVFTSNTCSGCNLDGSSGCNNIFLGQYAGKCVTSGDSNLLLGHCAGKVINSGSCNIIFGKLAGLSITTGQGNIAIGNQAIAYMGNANGNIAIGCCALTMGGGLFGNAIAIGKCAGRFACETGGSQNIMIGSNAGKCLTRGLNIALGGNALGVAEVACRNISVGTQSLNKLTTGCFNTTIGNFSSNGTTTGQYNITIGDCSGPATEGATGCHNFFGGHKTGNAATSGGGNIAVGREAGLSLTTGSFNIFMGTCAGANTGIGTENTFIGSCAGLCNTDGYQNVFIGYNAGKCHTTGVVNIAIGPNAGCCLKTGNTNTIAGNSAGRKLCSGSGNTLYGNQAGCAILTGGCNTVIGRDAGKALSTGSHNNVFGHFAGCRLAGGSSNLLMGNCAGYCLCGNSNVMLGRSSGFNRSGTKYNYNVLVGQNAGKSAGTLADGNYDVLIGYNAGCNYTGSCSIGIGHSVCLPIADGMNQLAIGHYEDRWITGNCDYQVGIGTTAARTKLHVSGPVHTDRFFQNPTSLDTTITFPESGGAVNGGVFGPYTIASGVTLTIASGSTFKVI